MPPRLFRLRTVPGRIRTLTAFAVLAVFCLFAVTGVAVLQARDGLRALGHDAGPAVIATSDLYLALSDMDAQVTNVLLSGHAVGWICGQEQARAELTRPGGRACDREPPRVYYEIRREDAQRAALQAAELADGDPVRLETVQTVLDGLHEYDQRVQAAMELALPAENATVGTPEDTAGNLPSESMTRYRSATALMTQDLLPKAYNLALANGVMVNTTYQDKRSATLAGRAGVVVTGLIAIAILAGLQVYVAVRFRRVLSPFLAVATLGAVALTVASASLLSTEAEYLRVAKTGGFDPVLMLSRTQAIGKSLDTDRGRFLLDPSDADRYDQRYLDKSQAILYIPGVRNLDTYYARLDDLLDRYKGDGRAVAFGGFYGEEARQVAVRGEQELLGTLLSRYQRHQHNDRRVRELADDDKRGAAAEAHMDPRLPYLAHPDFREYDEGLGVLVTRHQYLVGATVLNGERALRPWAWLLPGSVLVIAAFVVAGVRPRLNEYR